MTNLKSACKRSCLITAVLEPLQAQNQKLTPFFVASAGLRMTARIALRSAF